ncbi:MAG: hypothetical protein IJ869_01430 [Clostridiales bacterium]|nr:hypothetical protein [Clostridiales bacterium]
MESKEKLSEKYAIDEIADRVGGYFSVPSEEDMEYTDLLFSVCEQFGIRYYSATDKERFFVEEVTRVTWAIEHGETPTPSFVA